MSHKPYTTNFLARKKDMIIVGLGLYTPSNFNFSLLGISGSYQLRIKIKTGIIWVQPVLAEGYVKSFIYSITNKPKPENLLTHKTTKIHMGDYDSLYNWGGNMDGVSSTLQSASNLIIN